MKINFYSGLALLVLVIIFIIQNTETVNIRFLVWHYSMPRSLMIFAVLIVGMLLGWLIAGHFCKKHRNEE